METYGDTRVQFKAQYYVYALMFAIFDIETIFLLPWAMAYKEFATIFPLIEMIVFVSDPGRRSGLRLAQGSPGMALNLGR